MNGLGRRDLDRHNSLWRFSRPPIKETISISNTSSNPANWPAKGTVVTDQVMYRRLGDTMEIHMGYYQSAGGTAGTGSPLLVTVPGGYEIDTTKQPLAPLLDRTKSYSTVGHGSYVATTGVLGYMLCVQVYSPTKFAFLIYGRQIGTTGVLGESGITGIFGLAMAWGFSARVPIVGWK